MSYHTLRLLFNKRLDRIEELYIHISIRSFALSMISIFVPIYLLKLNYTLTSVFIFYALLNGVHALSILPAAKISSKIGCKHVIFFSIPFLVVFYFLLYTLELYHWPLYLLAIIFGVNQSLFWIGYHTGFSKFTNKNYRGEEISFAHIFKSIFSTIGPLTGGLILAFIGFKFLFVLVFLLLFLSTIPLFLSKDIHEPINFSVKQILTNQRIKNYLSFIGHGVETGLGTIIWPIYIFFAILNNFTVLGLVTSLSLLFSLIITFMIGKFSDARKRLVLRIGALLNAVIWAIKTFVRTTLQVFIIDSFYGITRTAISIPFDTLTYDKANKSKLVEFIIFREIFIQLGRVMLFIGMIFATDLISGFIFGSGASFLYLLF
jgi:MFS family permease